MVPPSSASLGYTPESMKQPRQTIFAPWRKRFDNVRSGESAASTTAGDSDRLQTSPREESSEARLLVPRPPDFYSGPPSAAAYAHLPETINGIRVARPKGVVAGSWEYPRELLIPPVLPRKKEPRDHEQWEFFRPDRLDPTPRPWAFPASLDNPQCQWLQTLKRLYAMPITFPASISPEGGMLLHAIVRNMRPRTVIETGTFLGVSAIWIAAALAENEDGAVLHCFDDFIPVRPGPWRAHEMNEGVLDFVCKHMEEAGLANNVMLHPGNSAYEIASCAQDFKNAGGVQLAYLDADHRPLGVSQDLWAVEPLLPTGGLVVLHDTFPNVCGDAGPRFVLDHVNQIATGLYQSVDLYLAPINYGLGVLRRIG